jgi:hypothetical protein
MNVFYRLPEGHREVIDVEYLLFGLVRKRCQRIESASLIKEKTVPLLSRAQKHPLPTFELLSNYDTVARLRSTSQISKEDWIFDSMML